ncbi:hypothetical protein CBM2609_A20029 [Cupriavidus taiwanensis]|nr:hypothetical protein CBM2604_A20028 [Cupriavidus taiwanensis]SOZ26368.1 hypothetical protein CBM2609_A20029 [Cupriavidus taiwanensis]SOZ45232.1 hypothetical protein CBM2610_A20018 [Cupriavidus taiwanensis]
MPGQQGCARYEVSPWHACIDRIAKAGQIDYHNLAYALVAVGGQSRIPCLSVSAAHAALVRNLPDIHREPFDRLLIARPCMSRFDCSPRTAIWRLIPISLKRCRGMP